MLVHVHGDSSLVCMLKVCDFEAVSPEISFSELNISDLAIYNIFIVSGNHKHICHIKFALFFLNKWPNSFARNSSGNIHLILIYMQAITESQNRITESCGQICLKWKLLASHINSSCSLQCGTD